LDALLQFGFLQRALLAGVFIAVACAVLGVFLVLRRDAMIGDGLSHVAFAGVALGLVLNVLPWRPRSSSPSRGPWPSELKARGSPWRHGHRHLQQPRMAVGILPATPGDFNVDL
jgi:hypothetical protein